MNKHKLALRDWITIAYMLLVSLFSHSCYTNPPKPSKKNQITDNRLATNLKKDNPKEQEISELSWLTPVIKKDIQSFQDAWFKDASASYNSKVYRKLVGLANKGNKTLERLMLLYPPNVDTPGKKVWRYLTLIEFYKNGTAEPYLTKQENESKISRLERERRVY